MVDDTTKKPPADANNVNINQQWELDYWTKEFDVTEKELKDAVKKVGTSVKKVKEELGVD